MIRRLFTAAPVVSLESAAGVPACAIIVDTTCEPARTAARSVARRSQRRLRHDPPSAH